MKDDLDKISWAEYDKKLHNNKTEEPKVNGGFTKEKLLRIVQVAELQGMKMFIWANCVQNYVRVYRNSMTDCVHKCIQVENITVRKEHKEVYFK